MGKWHRVVYNPTKSLKTQQIKLQLIIYIMDYKQKDILQKFASQKVGLGKIQDLDKITSKGFSLLFEAEKRIEEARNAVNRAYQITDELEDIIIQADNRANDIKGVFKDLDSPLSPSASKAIDEVEALEKEQRKLISAIKNVI